MESPESENNESNNKKPQIPTLQKLFHSVKYFKEELYPFLKEYKEFALSRYFVNKSLVNGFLSKVSFENAGKTNFINYDRWKDYYKNEEITISYLSAERKGDLKLPYKEIINFIKKPHAQILIAPDIGNYKINDSINELTQSAFDTFKRLKPKTTDGKVVRLASLKRLQKDTFEAKIENASYYQQVRTNLTLDFFIPGTGNKTLRTMDLSSSNNLSNFEKSIMVNSIGLSAVVFFTRGTEKYFLMKLRKDSDGVFETMFGTTSGVMEPLDTSALDNNNLVSLASKEMLREFFSETGIKKEHLSEISIKPLAFCRELIRGGKPQFFFAIEIPERLERNFKEDFRSSKEGLEEFHDSLCNKGLSFNKSLSPEFATNLCYAYQYFNLNAGKPLEPIHFE